jgi:hypothetical protein
MDVIEEQFYASSKAATPGNTLPSSISKEAPPPVEMCDILDWRLVLLTAATESPPPMMVMPPLVVTSASVWAIPKVPAENFSNSNTPCLHQRYMKIRGAKIFIGFVIVTMGPFHTTVLQGSNSLLKVAKEDGPISNPIQPSGISFTDTYNWHCEKNILK